MAPVGDRQTPDAQSAECRLRPPHGFEDCCPDSICQRRKHVGGGWPAQHMEQQPGSIQAEVC